MPHETLSSETFSSSWVDGPVEFDFAGRRARAGELIGEGALLLRAAPPARRSNDVEYDYRPDSDLFYLTGFEEPEGVLLLRNIGGELSATLFLRDRDPEKETWDGHRMGVERAKEQLGLDATFPIDKLDEVLPKLLEGVERLFFRWGRDHSFERKLHGIIERLRFKSRRGGVYPHTWIDSGLVLHELRVLKDETELGLMRRAAAITHEAHRAAMRVALPGAYEYDVEAELVRCFLRRGSAKEAYVSIVAAGSNATVLHYRDKGGRLEEGELLLIDAGCESRYYASDITRTFPIGGRFSGPQRAAYDVVLAAQKAAIDAVAPGRTLEAIHETALRIITEGLIDIGVLDGELDQLLEDQAFKPYFMHRSSHWLGMDVHDVGAYFRGREPRVLELGMVLTVEPGLYFGEGSGAPEAFAGIGIRIEDDILVTESGYENLNAELPKDPDELEAILADRR